MRHISDEAEKTSAILINGSDPMQTSALYIAQQALNWAEQPKSFRSPLATIMGISEASVDCSEENHLPRSLNIRDQLQDGF